MDIREQCEVIIQHAVDEVGPEKLALMCLAATRQIDADPSLRQTSYVRDVQGKYGGPYRIKYEDAADTLYDLGSLLWKAFIDTKEE